MKTLKNLICLFMLSMVFLACEPDGPGLDPKRNNQNFEASVTMSRIGSSYEGLTSVSHSQVLQLSGEGEATLKGKPFNIVLESSHTETYSVGSASFDIENGEFTVVSESGDQFYSTYSGVGTNAEGLIESIEECTIFGGTGRFLLASGNLSVRSERMIYQNSMQTTISGTIKLWPAAAPK